MSLKNSKIFFTYVKIFSAQFIRYFHTYLSQELCLYLDEERAGMVTVCTECGGPLPAPAPGPALPAPSSLTSIPRDEGDGSSSSTNNDEAEISASNLVEELNAVQAREKLYKMGGNKMGLNGE